VEKIFETILVDRIHNWMNDNLESRLSEDQYGFCRRKSTCDALMRVYLLIQEANDGGGVTVAVSLDIRNTLQLPPVKGDKKRA